MLSTKNRAKEYFEQKTNVVGGQRVFKGTRIPVERIIYLVDQENIHPKELIEDFPDITEEQIYFALWCAKHGWA